MQVSKERTGLILWVALLALLFAGFAINLGLNKLYQDAYNIPFGKQDVDNYMCMMGLPSYKVEGCEPGSVKTSYWKDPIHYPFNRLMYLIPISKYLNNPYFAPEYINIMFFIPFLVWFLYPLAMLFLCASLRLSPFQSFCVVFAHQFMTMMPFFTGIVAIWSQGFAYFFFILSIAAHYNRSNGKYLMAALCIFFHPATLIPYIVIMFLHLKWRDQVTFFPVFMLVGFIFEYMMGFGVVRYISTESINQPLIYHHIAILQNPFVLTYIWLKRDMFPKKQQMIVLVLFTLGVLSHNGRFMVFAIPFILEMFGHSLPKRMSLKSLWIWAFLLLGYTHFAHNYAMFMEDMMFEMTHHETRYIDPGKFLEIIR